MRFTSLDIVVVAVYMIGIAALGVYQARRIKNTGDFFAGGRSFNKFLMMMHALGTGTHADDPVGVVGAAFKHGIAGIWYTFVYLFVTPFYWIMAPLFRRSRFLTTADFFEARFGSKLGTLYAVWGIIIFAVNMGTLLKGTGLIVKAVTQGAIPEWMAITGMTIIFLLYGMAGGLIATVVTESIQGFLIVVMSLLLVPFGLSKLGWFSGLHQAVGDPSKFALTATAQMQELTVWWIFAGFLTSLIGIVAQPHTMEVCSTGKTEFEGRIGFTYGNFVKRLCAIGWAFAGVIVIGLYAKELLPAVDLQHLGLEREAAFGIAIRNLLPSGATGLMFAAILAAQMSTLSAFMVAASALLSRNIYQKHINPAADEKKMLMIARFAGLVIVALGVSFAFYVKGVADALMWFWTLSTFTGLFMWAGVVWRRTNATGAWASFAVMFLIWFVVAEPGDAIGQYMAKKKYQQVTAASVSQLSQNMQPITRSLFDVVQKRTIWEKNRATDKIERKNVVMLVTQEPGESFGMSFRPLNDADREAMNMVADKEGTLVNERLSGLVVTEVAAKSIAERAGIKPGDVILRQSRLSVLGVYSNKLLLHYRLLAFLPAGIIALIIGSLLGKPHPKDELDKFYALLKTPVGRENELIEQGVDVVYAGHTKGHPWEMNHARAVSIIGFLIAMLISGLFVVLLWGLTRIGA